MNPETDIFKLFDQNWGLLAAGTADRHNAMTISWGGLGTLWNKPVATVYVKPCRHTFAFLNENEYFTISFFDDRYRSALGIMGSLSGRDTDKDLAAGLTPKDLGKAITYEEANLTLLCRKLYWQDLSTDNMPEDVIKACYSKDRAHRMFIGEVTEILR
ncbi:MAG: flavin reductase [Solobacterium sp.]|nr:flavin reductase [Solobacterium sp.]